MREIIFRGKQKDSGDWVDGVPIQHSDGDWQIRGGFSNAGYSVTVDLETVCQYTGLTDKNGRKIFEGDICKYYNLEGEDGIAVIRKDYAEWKGGTIRQKEIMTPLFYLQCSKEWEVIGNIFDNPDLIGE